jgi:hypothetical protein
MLDIVVVVLYYSENAFHRRDSKPVRATVETEICIYSDQVKKFREVSREGSWPGRDGTCAVTGSSRALRSF